MAKVTKKLSYHFERPSIPRGRGLYSFMGYCPSENEIWLYLEATKYNEEDYDWLLLIPILEHEHIHAVLHRFQIHGLQQEAILRALELMRMEEVEDGVPNMLECPVCHKKSVIKDESGTWCWECS